MIYMMYMVSIRTSDLFRRLVYLITQNSLKQQLFRRVISKLIYLITQNSLKQLYHQPQPESKYYVIQYNIM